MILCLDVGNSQIYAGLYDKDELVLQFRKVSSSKSSSDEMGTFLRSVIRENGFDPDAVEHIAICSVVPDALYSLKGCCTKYFNITPFVLAPGSKTGLQIKYKHPQEVGADRIADAIAGVHCFPGKNLIIVDFGTATTVCATTKDKVFLGGNIIPGVRLSMEALEAKTARLPSVEIVRPHTAIGKTTVESIQSGLFWSNIGAIRELTRKISEEAFANEKPLVIGTGGFAHLFENEGIFDHVIPDLILKGLFIAFKLNH
jgi:type III pantothenate kinase